MLTFIADLALRMGGTGILQPYEIVVRASKHIELKLAQSFRSWKTIVGGGTNNALTVSIPSPKSSVKKTSNQLPAK